MVSFGTRKVISGVVQQQHRIIMNIGDKVKLKPPFNVAFPHVYQIAAIAAAPDTCTVDIWNDGVGSDFYIDYLEAL